MEEIPVKVWKKNRRQVGDGIYRMEVCFGDWDVHVPFTVRKDYGQEFLQEVGAAVPCNVSCRHIQGHTEDYARKRWYTEYDVKPLIDAARAFVQARAAS